MTMTGAIFDLKRFSVQDGPGIRTTVFLKGCPLNCVWCHNPESQAAERSVLFRPQLCIACGACEGACGHGALDAIRTPLLAPADGGGPSTSLRASAPPCENSLSDKLFVHTEKALDPSRCVGCGACAARCPSGALTMNGRRVSAEALSAEIARDVAFFDESMGGVTFSGGEPLAQPAFLAELLERCGRLGIHRTVDTSGYATAEVLAEIASRADLFLLDVKLLDSAEHRRWAGVPNEPILRNIRWLSETGRAMEIRMPVIPGITDTPGNLDAACAFLSSLPGKHTVRLLPHHRAAMAKYERFGIARRMPDVAEPTVEQVEAIAGPMRAAGLRVKTPQSVLSHEEGL